MTSPKGLLLNAVGRFVLRESRVASLREISDHVRSITLEGAALRDADWTPGDKIQILLPSLDVRTYTPMSWDRARGATELVVFDHGNSPGASWSRTVKVGDACRFVGPQRSLRRKTNSAVLFGDETSFAVACALKPSACVFEVTSRAEADAVIAALGMAAHGSVEVVERSPSDAHLPAIASTLDKLAKANGELLLTGRAQSIQALRSAGVRARGSNKAYWSVGKTGLD